MLAGVVVGGMTRLLSATLGGFLIGYVSGLLGGALPSSQSQYLPSFLFGLVILVLLVRPDGLFTRGPRPRGARVRAGRAAVELARAGAARRRGRDPRRVRLDDERDLLRHGAHLRLDRRRDLRLRRQLGRALVRPHQLLRGRRLGGGRPLDPRAGEARDDAVPLRLPQLDDGRERAVAPQSRRSSAVCSRCSSAFR